MGRRNINTTKSGKYMNPTDQARKEARKRELKKNKKQRQMVRAAVLKGKDPTQIVSEMEKLDLMEYNVDCPPTLSEKVLKDKRKKLKETLERVMKMYEKENPEYWAEIRRLEVDYEKKRLARIDYYEAVKHAQAVTVDEIPLPNLDMPSAGPEENADGMHMEAAFHIPNANLIPSHGILKSAYGASISQIKEPPGCPPLLPPDISQYHDGEDDDIENTEDQDALEKEEEQLINKSRSVRFADGEESDKDKDTRLTVKKSKNISSLQAKLLQMSGQDIDEFMRESEVLFNEKVAERQSDKQNEESEQSEDAPTQDQQPLSLTTPFPPRGVPPPQPGIAPPVLPGAPPAFSDVLPPGTGSTAVEGATVGALPPLSGPPGVPPPTGVPPPVMLRPPPRGAPPLLPGMRMPLGPPPQGLPPRLMPPMPIRPPLRVPGGVPPGMLPPSLIPRGLPPAQNPNVLSAEPQLIARPKESLKNRSATIQAKPQMRSLSADITRFLPTALRVKREDKKKSKQADGKDLPNQKPDEGERKPTKDDAYSQFMQEMQGLL